jgi:hypothetical protein
MSPRRFSRHQEGSWFCAWISPWTEAVSKNIKNDLLELHNTIIHPGVRLCASRCDKESIHAHE